MRIALLDLNHVTCGVHTNTVPLGLGLIATYVHLKIDRNIEIKIFKDVNKSLLCLKKWKPDVIGITQYSWNSELNLFIAGLIKQSNPACLVVAGGPNLERQDTERGKFFKNYPFVDSCVTYDGEIPFAEIIKLVLSGADSMTVRKFHIPGAYSFDHSKNTIIASTQKPPRLNSLDVFGPLYINGLFDEFLDDGFQPFLQTHRGCPFTCAFCHTSDPYYSRMLFLSPEIFIQDMEYLGRRFSGRQDVALNMANTNMSLFEQDFVIAKIIRQVQDKYDWPHIINLNSGKDPRKLLKMLSIIKFLPAIALQTLTPRVLKNIGRVNIPLNEFVSFQREVLKKTGEHSATELILCLPEETKKSFLATLRQVLNSGVQNVVIFTLMKLKGTKLSWPEVARKYGYVIRYRVVPRQFSLTEGRLIMDTEEVVVGTDTMPFDDYLELRGIAFIVTSFFSSVELMPLKRLLLELDLDLSQWVFGIHDNLARYEALKVLYDEFICDTKNELFVDRSSLIKFFEKGENFNALVTGKFGDNLLRKYKCLLLAKHYRKVLELAISEAGKLLVQRLGEKISKDLLSDMSKYLLTRQLQDIFHGPAAVFEKSLRFNFDIPAWLASENKKIENLRGSFEYRVKFNEDARVKIKDFLKMNKNEELSLQILYRDGNTRDFWPRLDRIYGNL